LDRSFGRSKRDASGVRCSAISLVNQRGAGAGKKLAARRQQLPELAGK
jgi:hypothetical protein